MADNFDFDVLAIGAARGGFAAALQRAPVLLAALILAACDAAGSLLDDTARLAAVEQCRQVSEGAGIAAGAVEGVCNCVAGKWLAKPVAERVQLDRATIQTTIDECAGTKGESAPARLTETN